ncbi:hypothetical protein Tco_0864114 [Tanacetum coccineum]
MRTRRSNYPNNSNVTIPRRRRRQVSNIVEPEIRTIVAPMAERTMEELLRAPTEGYGEAIVLPEINADHFEIKTNLLHEAWERFKELLRACPHHGFTELTQVDTFYNGLNENEQDSLNAAAGGNLLSKTTREALNIIENKSKVRYSRNKPNASRINATSSKTDERTDKLAYQLSTLVEIVSKKVCTLPRNTIQTRKDEIESITTKMLMRDRLIPTNPSPKKVIPISISEPDVLKTLPKTTPISESDIPKNLPKPNIPYPSRRDDQKSHDKASNQMGKIFQIFQDLRFDISFTDALLLMPRFAPTIRDLLRIRKSCLN